MLIVILHGVIFHICFKASFGNFGTVNEEILIMFTEKIKSKWKKLGHNLKIPSKELDSFSSINPMTKKNPHMKVLTTWKEKQTVPYTWNEFFKALTNMGETRLVTEIIGVFTIIVTLFSYFIDKLLEWPEKCENLAAITMEDPIARLFVYHLQQWYLNNKFVKIFKFFNYIGLFQILLSKTACNRLYFM